MFLVLSLVLVVVNCLLDIEMVMCCSVLIVFWKGGWL